MATDARLTKAQAKRIAIAASGGALEGLRLAHAIFDGDTMFAASTGRRTMNDPTAEFIEICALASDCLARGSRGRCTGDRPSLRGSSAAWRDKFGRP